MVQKTSWLDTVSSGFTWGPLPLSAPSSYEDLLNLQGLPDYTEASCLYVHVASWLHIAQGLLAAQIVSFMQWASPLYQFQSRYRLRFLLPPHVCGWGGSLTHLPYGGAATGPAASVPRHFPQRLFINVAMVRAKPRPTPSAPSRFVARVCR